MSTESIFLDEGDGRFTPTEHARGPWDPRALHGGAPAALIAAAFERIEPGAELPLARLSFSFLRPIPLAPLELSTRVTRPGRRVQELEADLHADGVLVCRARALRILPAPEELPELASAVVQAHGAPAMAPPQEGHEIRFALDDPDRKSFAATAMQMRFLEGQPLTGRLPELDATAHTPSGRAAVWMRLRHPLLPSAPATPLASVMAAADFGNGVSAALPFDRYLFINADLTISLNRRPEGEWIGLQARTLLHPGGIGWAESVLHDERGELGLATQALVVQRR
jgi:acyl-coenzyme A thioesterase PaaI-like protein